jgi:hypothetical protein
MHEVGTHASKAEIMAFTGVSFIRSVRFGGYTFILQSIAYPSAGSERTYVIDEMLEGRLLDHFIRCFDIDISLNAQIQETLPFVSQLAIKVSGCPTPTSAFPLGKFNSVPIECLTFAELRHHAVLNRSRLCLAIFSTNPISTMLRHSNDVLVFMFRRTDSIGGLVVLSSHSNTDSLGLT